MGSDRGSIDGVCNAVRLNKLLDEMDGLKQQAVIQKFWITVVFAPDVELVQVRINPAHRCLDVFVQLVERAVVNLNSPPDRRIRYERRDLELVASASVGLCLRLFSCIRLSRALKEKMNELNIRCIVNAGGQVLGDGERISPMDILKQEFGTTD